MNDNFVMPWEGGDAGSCMVLEDSPAAEEMTYDLEERTARFGEAAIDS